MRYDIYGRDVLIANKMESNGERGKVLISQSTYDLIQASEEYSQCFLFTKREENVEVKAINKSIEAYFVELSDSFSMKSSMGMQDDIKE